VFQTKIGVKRQGFSLPFGAISMTFLSVMRKLSFISLQWLITVNNYSRLEALKRVLHQALAARLVTMSCVGISSGRFLPRTHLQKQKKRKNAGDISSLTLLYPQKIWYLGELRHSLFFTVFSRKRQFNKGRLEPAKKGLHTNRKGRTKHKSHHKANGEIQSFLTNMLVLS